MKEQQNATVDELNTIQTEWMKLDPFAEETEKRRVFKLMERLPKIYVSGHAEELRGVKDADLPKLSDIQLTLALSVLCGALGAEDDPLTDELRSRCCTNTHKKP